MSIKGGAGPSWAPRNDLPWASRCTDWPPSSSKPSPRYSLRLQASAFCLHALHFGLQLKMFGFYIHTKKNIFSKNLKIISFNVHRQFVLKSIFQLKLRSNYMSTNSKNKIFLVKYLNLYFYRASHNQVAKTLS